MGRCEKCGNCGVQMHHRKNRSQGGEWNPANILLLCVKCHTWVGSYPLAAKEVGLHVMPNDDPQTVPIRTGNVPFLLLEDGCLEACNELDVLLPLPGCAR